MDPVADRPTLELRQVRYFLAVAEELSFTRAAHRLHVAQQALSVAIRQLETQLGVMLFDRSTRRLELTAAGHVLVGHARELLAAAHRAADDTVRAGGRLTGTLAIGCSYDAQHAVADGFRRFRERWPDVELSVSLLLEPALTDGLRAGRLDGAVSWDLDAGSADLGSVEVSEEEVVALLPPGHPLAACATVSRDALAGERIVLFDRHIAPGVFDRLVSQLHDTSTVAADVTFADAHVHVSGQEAMIESVRRGQGVTVITRRVFDRLRPAGVVARSIEPPMFAGVVFTWVEPARPALRALASVLMEDAGSG